MTSLTVDKVAAGTPATLDAGTRLALKRTQLAAERTLMAWVRTAFSMISFGFTIGKFLDYLANQPDSRVPLGEHNLLPKLRTLSDGQPVEQSAVGVVSTLVGLLGILAFAGLLIPF